MAGGLFGKPFAVNAKCVVFAIIVIALFLARPQLRSRWAKVGVPGALFVIAYVAMAWYDYYYDCRLMPLQRGGGPTSTLKPPVHLPGKQHLGKAGALSEVEQRRSSLFIYAAHVAVIAPLLGYVAYMGRHAPNETWVLLGAVAVLTAGYHGAKLAQTL